MPLWDPVLDDIRDVGSAVCRLRRRRLATRDIAATEGISDAQGAPLATLEQHTAVLHLGRGGSMRPTMPTSVRPTFTFTKLAGSESCAWPL